jgi:subtilisin
MQFTIFLRSFCCFLAIAAAEAEEVRTNHYIVTCRGEVDAQHLAGECKSKAKHVYCHALHGFVAALTLEEVEKLKRDKRVLAVELDGPITLCGQTNGAGITRMGLTQFPVARINGRDERIDVDVAVIDTGIQLDHPDLNVVRHVRFAGSGLTGEDWQGHGTHVAGIIGAKDNDFGMVGVAAGARLWSVQVIGPTNSAWSNALAGLEYVAQHANEIEVANCSFIGESQSPVVAVQEAIRKVVELGVVVVAGVGNSRINIIGRDRVWGTEDDTLPAAFAEVMAVSAMDPETNLIWEFSSYSSKDRASSVVISKGSAIDVAAPGVSILSCFTNGTYSIRNGTSMATAHASGLVALHIAANGRAHNISEVYQIRQAIVDASVPQERWAGGIDHFAEDPDAHKEPLAIPSETWIPAPRIIAQIKTSVGFEITFTTVPGYTYTVQRLKLLQGVDLWADFLSTNGTGNPILAIDATANMSGFYRVARTSGIIQGGPFLPAEIIPQRSPSAKIMREPQ